ncbi:MAG: polysaccharide deacetylase family protein [Holophagales bacterium]|nr:polysaccharide deacetylase family protein [Holophagales bacterium]
MSWKRQAAGAAAHLARGTGVLAGLRTLRKRSGYRVHILEYHGVDPENREWQGTISQRRFRRHVEWLNSRYGLVTVTEAARRLASGELEQDLVALTFDDGYADNVSGAFPALEALGVPATIYLTTGFLDGQPLWFDVARRSLHALSAAGAATVGASPPASLESLGPWPPSAYEVEGWMSRLKVLPAAERLAAVAALEHVVADAGLELGEPARPMTWDQARALRAAGLELGAHTVSHPILSRLEPAAQEEEIRGSRDRLAEELGEPPRTFAIPNGSARDYDAHTLDLLRRLGFEACCTTRRGSNPAGCEPFELRRVGVGSDSLPLLEARLAGLFDEAVRRHLPF